MNEYRDDKTCYLHPREVVIGICALCLNERLLVLASQQEQLHQANNSNNHRIHSFTHRRNPMNLPRIFALSSLLNRLDLRHRKSDDQYYCESSGSQEDSFISIKFEDNGAASWEKNKVLPKMPIQHSNTSLQQSLSKGSGDLGVKAVIEHPNPRGSMRWRKRIGHLFQLIRWKKSSKGNVCHVGAKIDGVKVRHGWIRALTKRRTKE